MKTKDKLMMYAMLGMMAGSIEQVEREPTPKPLKRIKLKPSQLGYILTSDGFIVIENYYLAKDKEMVILGRNLKSIARKIKKRFPLYFEDFCKQFQVSIRLLPMNKLNAVERLANMDD